jgi:hemolysin III
MHKKSYTEGDEMAAYTFTQKEEKVNAITHGIGAIFSLIALVILLQEAIRHNQPWQIISASIYGVSMFLMYMSSTLMHSLPEGKAKEFFLRLDYSSIFLFIAGTYTPISILLIKGVLGWTILLTIWFFTLIGIVFKIVFVEKFTILSTIIYIALGWFVVIAWDPLVSKLAYQGLVMLIFGGICYTVGTIFFLWRTFPYHHAVWHVFVIIGSALHFLTIYQYVIGG